MLSPEAGPDSRPRLSVLQIFSFGLCVGRFTCGFRRQPLVEGCQKISFKDFQGVRYGREQKNLFRYLPLQEAVQDCQIQKQRRVFLAVIQLLHGVFDTGDTAWRDSDGYYWFEGRSDDVIKCSGYRIGPFEVESALMTHPCVLECAVTAAPDPVRGQVVKATIVLAKGFTASEELVKELQTHVKHTTAPYKYPRIIEFVSELPKTVSGKIKRSTIRRGDHQA